MYIFLIINHKNGKTETHEGTWDERGRENFPPAVQLGEFYKYAIYQEFTDFSDLSTKMSADEFNTRYNEGQRLFYLQDDTSESVVAMLDEVPQELRWIADVKAAKQNLADYADLIYDANNYLDGHISEADFRETLDNTSNPV